MLVTDMNDRERTKFATKARMLSESTSKLAEALESNNGDDSEALVYLTIVSLSGEFINELAKIFAKAAGVEIPDSPEQLSVHPLAKYRREGDQKK
jgi:hypothetical protein